MGEKKVVVAGAGPSGLAAAAEAYGNGLEVEVRETANDARRLGRVLAERSAGNHVRGESTQS